MLCGHVWYPQIKRIVDVVREAKNNIAYVWVNKELSNKAKRIQANEIRQECIDYVCNTKLGDKTMRYLIELIDSKEYSDISRFLFTILFGKPNEEFYKLIELSKSDLYKLEECNDGDIMIYEFCYRKVLV